MVIPPEEVIKHTTSTPEFLESVPPSGLAP